MTKKFFRIAPFLLICLLLQQPCFAGSYANANLAHMDFSRQDLTGTDFSNATLTGANFAGSNLTNTNFSNATLTGVNFTSALLQHAGLVNTNLDNAILSNADLSDADLTNASLRNTLVDGTSFRGANLTNVDMSYVLHQPRVAVVAQPAPAPTTLVDAGAIAKALAVTHKIDLTINFDFNSDKLTSDGQRQVQEIAGALKSGTLQASRILIEGHTDNVGSAEYNQDLSYRRAMRVMRFLIETDGIPAGQLSAQGFGKTRPVASNDTDLGRAKNRRVTLVNLGQ